MYITQNARLLIYRNDSECLSHANQFVVSLDVTAMRYNIEIHLLILPPPKLMIYMYMAM